MEMNKKVGIVGVGNMGSKMAEKLMKAGYTVFARDIDKKLKIECVKWVPVL